MSYGSFRFSPIQSGSFRLLSAWVPAVALLFAAARAEYQKYSPVLWRPAADPLDRHTLLVDHLIDDPDTIALVEEGCDGALIGTPRGDGYLIDDFTVRPPAQWSGLGRQLLRAFLAAIETGSVVTVVSAQRDIPKVSMLSEENVALAREWWTVELAAQVKSVHAADGNQAEIIEAPPVYDPGGPVAMTQCWMARPRDSTY